MELVLDFFRIYKDLISSLCMVITAISAIVIGSLQMRRHMRSYTPYCDICCLDYNGSISIKIQNNGTGVMTITETRVLSNNSNIVHYNLLDCIPEYIPLDYYSVDLNGKSIAPKDHLTILKFIKENPNDYALLRNILKKYTLQVFYKDMYSTRTKKVEKNLFDIYGIEHRAKVKK